MSKSNGHQPVPIAEREDTAGEGQNQDADNSERGEKVDRCRSLLAALDQIKNEFVTVTENVRAIVVMSKGIAQVQQEVIGILENTLDEGPETLVGSNYNTDSEKMPVTQQPPRPVVPARSQVELISTENPRTTPETAPFEENGEQEEHDDSDAQRNERLSWESTDQICQGTVKLRVKASPPALAYRLLETLRENPNTHVLELVSNKPKEIGISLRLQKPMRLEDYLRRIDVISGVETHGWIDHEGKKQHVFNVELVEPLSPN